MAREIELQWTPACRWVTGVGLPVLPSAQGLYQISRMWGGTEALLYLGIVWADSRSFQRRIYEHRRDWLGSFRGLHFRFGHILPRRGLVRDRALIEEIEGALIGELQPEYNSSKRNSYSLRYDLDIRNRGDRGAIPKRINTEDHEWVSAPGGRARVVSPVSQRGARLGSSEP